MIDGLNFDSNRPKINSNFLKSIYFPVCVWHFCYSGTYFPIFLQVTRERGEELAIEYGFKFMETSAKASINVEEAFYTLARDIKAKQLVRQSILYGLLTCILKSHFKSHYISLF